MNASVWLRVGTCAVVGAVFMMPVNVSAQVADEVRSTVDGRDIVVEKQDGTSLEDDSAAPPPPPRKRAAIGRQAVVITEEGEVAGKLIDVDDTSVVLEKDGGEYVTIARASIKSVQERQARPDPPSDAGDTPLPAGAVEPANGPQGTVASSAAEQSPSDPPPAPPSPWSAWFGVGAGPAWGDAVTKRGIGGPSARVHFDAAIAYHFVYAGTGFAATLFKDSQSFTQVVVPVDGSGGPETRQSSTSAGSGYIEAGIIHGFFISSNTTDAFELRPGIGYGLEAISSVTRGIGNCVDCRSQEVTDYHAGHYLRFQLGIYYSNHKSGGARNGFLVRRRGWFLGVTPSYQHFIFGSYPRLEHSLTFSLTGGFL